MRCEEVRPLLPGAADGGAADEVRRHVEGCPACAAELEAFARARERLRSLAPQGSRRHVVRAVLDSVDRDVAFRAAAEGQRRRAAARRLAALLALAPAAGWLAWWAVSGGATGSAADRRITAHLSPIVAPQRADTRPLPAVATPRSVRVRAEGREGSSGIERPGRSSAAETAVLAPPPLASSRAVDPTAQGRAARIPQSARKVREALAHLDLTPVRRFLSRWRAVATATGAPDTAPPARREVNPAQPPSSTSGNEPVVDGRTAGAPPSNSAPGSGRTSAARAAAGGAATPVDRGNGLSSLADAPVTWRRSGERLLLVTRGSPARVVPALLPFLASPDERVRSAAEARLWEIRSELEDDPALADVLGAVEDAGRPEGDEDRGLASLFPFGRKRDPVPAEFERDPAKRWRRWWRRAAPHVADLERLGTR